MKRFFLAGLGLLCMGLGVAGMVLPVLPSTIFFILAATCFAHSSARLHRWLLANRVFGEYIRRYWSGEGMSLKAKAWTIGYLWFGLALSAFLMRHSEATWVRWLLLAVGIGVSLHVALIRTWRPKRSMA